MEIKITGIKTIQETDLKMATRSIILAWKILWTEEPGYSPLSHKELDISEQLSTHIDLICVKNLLEKCAS